MKKRKLWIFYLNFNIFEDSQKKSNVKRITNQVEILSVQNLIINQELNEIDFQHFRIYLLKLVVFKMRWNNENQAETFFLAKKVDR